MTFFAWFDDHPKKSAEQKIDEAILMYVGRFGEYPNVIYINQDDVTVKAREGVDIRVQTYIRKHHYWLGRK